MKKILKVVLALTASFALLLSLFGCGDKSAETEKNGEIYAVYTSYVAYAQENGIAPLSYEEWLSTIKGEKGDKGDKGDSGVGIVSISIDDNGYLIVNMSTGESVNAGKVINKENLPPEEPISSGKAYKRVNENGKEVDDGKYIYFGSYPQTDMTESMSALLNDYVANKPTAENDNGWKSYKYYISGSNEIDFMWYKDVDFDSDGESDYRAVYFTNYRPYDVENPFFYQDTYQDTNGYYAGNVYWFKFEPIKWRILKSENGYATLLSTIALDSQEYNYTSINRTIDGNTVYANNYEYSSIRTWLNGIFYDTAFSYLEKSIIQTIEIDKGARSSIPDNTNVNHISDWENGENAYACNNTFDKLWLLSEQEATKSDYGFNINPIPDDDYEIPETSRLIHPSDYAKSQGCYSGTLDEHGVCCDWWLRSPRFSSNFKTEKVDYDGYADNYSSVYNTCGVVPALVIFL